MKSSNLRKLQTLPECFDLFDESDLLLHLLILQICGPLSGFQHIHLVSGLVYFSVTLHDRWFGSLQCKI